MLHPSWRIPAWIPRFVMLVAIALGIILLAGGPIQAIAQGGVIADSTGQAGVATGGEQLGSGGKVAGQRLQMQSLSQPPVLTAEEQQMRDRLMAKSNRAGPNVQVASIPASEATGPKDAAPQANQPSAPGDMNLFRDSTLPAGALFGSGDYSYTQESSTGNNGKNVFQTGNWYASYSPDNGATWRFLDPYTAGGTWNFCCDQVTLYDPGRDIQLWRMQGDHLRLGVAGGTNLTSWCFYDLYPGNFGQPATTEIDYNDMNISESNLFITSNLFPAGGGKGAGVMRLSLDALATCAGTGVGYIAWVPGGSHGWSFTWKLISGAGRTMYWASDWNQGLTSGSTIRIFKLDDTSGTYYWYDRAINAFSFFTRNSGQNCATGGVTNWCAFNDSRVKGGALARGILYFSMDAKQGGSFPFPYTRIVKFNQASMGYLGDKNKWATWGAIQYASLAVNNRGELGMAYSVGGKNVDGGNFYPTTAVALQDDYGNFSNSILYFLFGDGNTCTYGGILRWGDYTTVRPFWPVGDEFLASGWTMRGGNCGSQGVYGEAHNIVFGRGRDASSYYRWAPY